MDKSALKKLVEADIEKALDALENLHQDEPAKHNIIIRLKGRYNLNYKAWVEGLLPQENFEINNNKILVAILDFIDHPDRFSAEELINFVGGTSTTIELPRLEIELVHPKRISKGRAFSRTIISEGEGSKIAFYLVFTSWKFKLILHNNSKFAAYNARLEFPKLQFTDFEKPNEYSAIQPWEKIELVARYTIKTEKTYAESTRYIESSDLDQPSNFEDLEILIHYKNEHRVPITNRYWIKDGKGYNEIISRK